MLFLVFKNILVSIKLSNFIFNLYKIKGYILLSAKLLFMYHLLVDSEVIDPRFNREDFGSIRGNCDRKQVVKTKQKIIIHVILVCVVKLICIYERLFCRHVKTFRENKLKI
jgi:hypothetical protein